MSTAFELDGRDLNFDPSEWIVDGQGTSPPFDGSYDQDPASYQPFDGSLPVEIKGAPSPSPGLAIPQTTTYPESPLSSPQDSASDSSSSKRTRSSRAMSSGDILMTDGLDVKSPWGMDEFLNIDGDHSVPSDGTINPKSIQHQFDSSSHLVDHFSESPSESSASSPNHGLNGYMESPAMSPETADATAVKASPSSARISARRHNKAFSVRTS
jgi:hypothetical protein